MVFDVINQFDIWNAVPPEGSASYAEIAKHTHLPIPVVARILRMAMTTRLFAETTPGSGQIVHTANSAFIAKHPVARAWILRTFDESAPAQLKLAEALRAYSLDQEDHSGEPGESAMARAFYNADGNPDLAGKTYFDWIEEDGEGEQKGWRSRRFVETMRAFSLTKQGFVDGILERIDWVSLGEKTVVDVSARSYSTHQCHDFLSYSLNQLGGSTGHISILLAQKYPNLKLIVQDFAAMEPGFRKILPPELSSRVSFQAHNFFTPQKTSADIFFIKHIFHDWSDPLVIKILHNLIPVLKPRSRIVLYEGIMPELTPSNAEETLPVVRSLSALDLQILVYFNGKERTVREWDALVTKADERFALRGVHLQPGSHIGLLEWEFTGEPNGAIGVHAA